VTGVIGRIAPTAAVLSALAVLAGCGGTGDRSAQDAQVVGRARLAPGDMAGRWVAMPNGGTLSCPALAGSGSSKRAASDLLTSERGVLDDVVFVFPNALAARIQTQAILSDEGRECIGRRMWDGAPAAVRSTTLDVDPIGDHVHAVRFTPQAGRDRFDGVLDVVVVVIGRAAVVVEVSATPARLDAGLRASAVAAAVRKLRAAIDR
jgi:hypothetical protein